MSNVSHAGLPKSVDPFKLAEQNSTLEGVIPLEALSRFREVVLGIDDGSECRVKLSFHMDEERRRVISGELEAPVNLECQRCMGSMPVTLASRFSLGLVTTDTQAQNLPKDLEPFLTEDFSADLWSMVEDELLLVLPSFPLHERNEDLEAYEPETAQPVKVPAENPFSVLAGLKAKKH